MTLTTARDFVRYAARNAGDTTQYSDADVDRAIQVAADRFVRRTKSTRSTSNLTITAASSAVSFTAITDFRPERLIRAWIPAEVAWLQVIDHQELTRLQVTTPKTDDPEFIAFDAYDSAELYPTPSASFTGRVMWWQPFTTWTPGAAASLVTSFNLPDDFLRPLLTSGAAYELQKNEPEHQKFVAQRKVEFDQFILEMLGAGGLGAKVAIRQKGE